jgi:hypothetical protein
VPSPRDGGEKVAEGRMRGCGEGPHPAFGDPLPQAGEGTETKPRPPLLRPMDMLAAALFFATAIANPAIDMEGYLRAAQEAAAYRESRRVTEDEFIAMAAEPGTIILDARSPARFDELHVKGAINLSFSDIAVASLADTIPDKNTRILIYCNNNFIGDEKAFASKIAKASLNLSTFIALYSYGYRNVYELGPLVDMTRTKIIFAGDR